MKKDKFRKILIDFASCFLILGLSGCAMEPPYTPSNGKKLVRVCTDEYTAGAKQKEGDDAEVSVGFKLQCVWKEVDANQQNNSSILSFNEWFVQWQLLSDILDGKSPWELPSYGQMKTSPSGTGFSIKFSGQNYAIPYKQGNARIRFYRNGAEIGNSSTPYFVDQNGLYFTDQRIKDQALLHMELAESVSLSVEIENVPFKIVDTTPGTLVLITTAVSDGQKLLKVATGSFITRSPPVCRFYCYEP